MHCEAYAKLNLSLDILRRRDDGYHDLTMVMQSVALCDGLTLSAGEPGVRVRTNLSYLPDDGHNLAAVAAQKFGEETGWSPALDIVLEKHIPVCAGMAGGSSDAAAVLRALNELTGAGLAPSRLCEIGALCGSDVPYCVMGGTALAEGRGEVLTPLPPLPRCPVVVCKPSFSVSTPELFSCVDVRKITSRPDTKGILDALERGDLPGVARRMYNVFEDVLPKAKGETVRAIKEKLIDCGALGAVMTGSGPTVFGLFGSAESAQSAYDLLRQQYRDTFLTETVGSQV